MNANGEANNNSQNAGSIERASLSKYWLRILAWVKSLFVFLWLGLLYFVLLFAVVGTLSSYQFQQRVKQFVDDEAKSVVSTMADANKLDKAKTREPKLKEEIKNLEIDIKRTEQSMETQDIDNDVLVKMNAHYDKLDQFFLDSGFAAEELEELFDPDSYRNFLDLNRHRFDFDQLLEISILIDNFAVDYAGFVKEYNATDEEKRVANNKKMNTLLAEMGEIEKIKAAVPEKILVINDELRVLKSVCVGPFFEFGPFCFGDFAVQTSAVLVLFLTLAMGMLGSTIFITQEYVVRGSGHRPITWFLIRPALGMVTAIAIFVLAKAGQLGLSESADNLNPWVISFLAVISGLLSEHAVERIGRSAKPIFDPDGSQLPRWGVTLDKELEEFGIDRDKLANALNVTRTKLDEWASQKSSVPHREQELIASWLRMPVRELFTDIAPDATQSSESAIS